MVKMKQSAPYLLVLLLALFFGRCNSPNSPDCFKSRGSDATERREISSFDEIEVRDYLNVVVVPDDEYFVVVEGGENLLPKIRTDVEGGRLIIDNKNTCNFVRSFRYTPTIEVHVPHLAAIILQDGAGELQFADTLSGEYLFVETNHASGDIFLKLDYDRAVLSFPTGTSNVEVEGRVDQLEIFSDAYGSVDADAVMAQIVLVNNSSIRDFMIRTQSYFYAEINDRGNVYVRGTVNNSDVVINGSGEVIILE